MGGAYRDTAEGAAVGVPARYDRTAMTCETLRTLLAGLLLPC